MKYIVEYIFNETRDWTAWYKYGKGLKTNPLTPEQFIVMDKDRQSGKYIFFNIEVIE